MPRARPAPRRERQRPACGGLVRATRCPRWVIFPPFQLDGRAAAAPALLASLQAAAGSGNSHHFYHLLCPGCAERNWAKRAQRADLHGRVRWYRRARAVGFQTALRLLRDGADVVVNTCFPKDAQQRFLAMPDADPWRDRLTLEALDLRNVLRWRRLLTIFASGCRTSTS